MRMRKDLFNGLLLAILVALLFSSCARSIIPTAKSTINSVSLEELNLTRADYDIISTIEASATMVAKVQGKGYTLKDPNGDFSIVVKKDVKLIGGVQPTEIKSSKGVLRLGYLANDYEDYKRNDPEDIARRLAKYRLIQLAKEQGADGVIEPIVSMSIEQTGWREYTYYCTVSAKAIKLIEKRPVNNVTVNKTPQKSHTKK